MKATPSLSILTCLLLACVLWCTPARAELLGRALRHDDAELRTYLEQNMPPVPAKPLPPTEEDIRMLAELFDESDEAEAEYLAWVLGDWAGQMNVDLLLRVGASQWPKIRAQAASSFAMLGPVLEGEQREQAVRGLARLLTDEDRQVVLAALRATGRLQAAGALDAVVRCVCSDDPDLAIRAVVSLKAATHEDRLLALLDDAHGYVRREALKGLVQLGGAEHEKVYLVRTEDPDHTVRRVAAQALGQFRLRSGIGRLYALFADLHLYVRDDAVLALVAMGDPKVIELAGQGLTSPIQTVRASSSQTLGRLRSDRNLEAHIALLKDPYLPARQWAAWALGEIGRKEACIALGERAFAADEDYEAKFCAMLSLGKLGYVEALPGLQTLAAAKGQGEGVNEPLLSLRVAAVRAMGLLKQEGSIGLLSSRLTDEDPFNPEAPEVKYESAAALGRIGSQKAAGPLDTYIKRKGGPQKLRYGCRWALTRIEGKVPDYQIPPPDNPQPDYFVRRLPPPPDMPGSK